jgi:RNA polymerase sigma factor (sigma-70 family)
MPETHLLELCMRGDQAAWREFFLRYGKRMYNAIFSTLASRGYPYDRRDAAGEIFQGIIASLIDKDYRKLRQFRFQMGTPFSSWLRAVSVHASIDYLRKCRYAVSLSDVDEEELAPAMPHVRSCPFDELMRREIRAALAECAGALSLEDRLFLTLYIRHDFSLEDIRILLGLKRGALYMRKLRIIKRLQELLLQRGIGVSDEAAKK